MFRTLLPQTQEFYHRIKQGKFQAAIGVLEQLFGTATKNRMLKAVNQSKFSDGIIKIVLYWNFTWSFSFHFLKFCFIYLEAGDEFIDAMSVVQKNVGREQFSAILQILAMRK